MSITKNKSLNIIIGLILLLSLAIPALTKIVLADDNITIGGFETIGSPDSPTLTIHKYEQESDQFCKDPNNPEDENCIPGSGFGDDLDLLDGVTAVPDVTYELVMTHKLNEVTNNDGTITQEWTEVSDAAPFQVTTDSDGQAIIPDIEKGRYEVTEIDAPSHILINQESFFVEVPMTNERDGTQYLNYDVHVFPKNEIIRGDVVLLKQDENENPLSRIVFGLYNEDGEPLLDDENNEVRLTTDSNGQISYSGLVEGKYYFQEIEKDFSGLDEDSTEWNALEKITLNDTPIWFEVVAGKQNVIEWTEEDGFVTSETLDPEDEDSTSIGIVTNYHRPEIEKTVEEKEHHVVDREKEYNYEIDVKLPEDIQKYKFIKVTDILDNRLYAAKDENDNVIWNAEGIDESKLAFTPNGQELIWEIDEQTLETLEAGLEFRINFKAKIKEDAVLEEDEIGIPNDATITFDNNRGYDDDTKTPPVTVDPDEGKLKVIKISTDTGETLEGAEFELQDLDGNVIDTTNFGDVVKVNDEIFNGKLEGLVTDENGVFTIEGLTPGEYTLKETKAPTYLDENGVEKPYRILTDPVKITIKGKEIDNDTGIGTIIETDKEIKNSKNGWYLPSTGGMGTLLFTIAGLLLMGIAAYTTIRRKHQLNN